MSQEVTRASPNPPTIKISITQTLQVGECSLGLLGHLMDEWAKLETAAKTLAASAGIPQTSVLVVVPNPYIMTFLRERCSLKLPAGPFAVQTEFDWKKLQFGTERLRGKRKLIEVFGVNAEQYDLPVWVWRKPPKK